MEGFLNQNQAGNYDNGGRREMKRKLWMIMVCMMMILLTACQGKKLLADTTWEAAKKSKNLNEYVKTHADELDLEVLKAEAESAENSLSQRFKATVLLCRVEYQKYQSAQTEGVSSSGISSNSAAEFRFAYPESSLTAETFLANVNTQGEEFWKVMDEMFSPYDAIATLFSAAKNLDGETLVNFINGIPADSIYKNRAKEAVDQWIKQNPGKLANVWDGLVAAGYYDTWELYDFKTTYFNDEKDQRALQVETVADAVAYCHALRTGLLPKVESMFTKEELQTASKITQEQYYTTKMAVAVNQPLTLKEKTEEGLPETIETEGKKVAAFYLNPQSEEYEGSPAGLRILGDFMLSLPEEEVPATIEEADYFLVLTPDYKDGNNYQTYGGKETKIMQVNSSTSADLYDGKTGDFLRHLGNLIETPPESIYDNLELESSKYPDVTGADVLTYLYHNINQPDAYITLLDHTSGLTGDLQLGESVVLDQFQITLRSCKVVKSFRSGMFEYTAKEGNQFVIGDFAVTNRGFEKDEFLPTMVFREVVPLVKVADSKRENFYNYANSIGISGAIASKYLDPGESVEGKVYFEVPDEVALGAEPYSIALTYGIQSAYYAVP